MSAADELGVKFLLDDAGDVDSSPERVFPFGRGLRASTGARDGAPDAPARRARSAYDKDDCFTVGVFDDDDAAILEPWPSSNTGYNRR